MKKFILIFFFIVTCFPKSQKGILSQEGNWLSKERFNSFEHSILKLSFLHSGAFIISSLSYNCRGLMAGSYEYDYKNNSLKLEVTGVKDFCINPEWKKFKTINCNLINDSNSVDYQEKIFCSELKVTFWNLNKKVMLNQKVLFNGNSIITLGFQKTFFPKGAEVFLSPNETSDKYLFPACGDHWGVYCYYLPEPSKLIVLGKKVDSDWILVRIPCSYTAFGQGFYPGEDECEVIYGWIKMNIDSKILKK